MFAVSKAPHLSEGAGVVPGPGEGRCGGAQEEVARSGDRDSPARPPLADALLCAGPFKVSVC